MSLMRMELHVMKRYNIMDRIFHYSLGLNKIMSDNGKWRSYDSANSENNINDLSPPPHFSLIMDSKMFQYPPKMNTPTKNEQTSGGGVGMGVGVGWEWRCIVWGGVCGVWRCDVVVGWGDGNFYSIYSYIHFWNNFCHLFVPPKWGIVYSRFSLRSYIADWLSGLLQNRLAQRVGYPSQFHTTTISRKIRLSAEWHADREILTWILPVRIHPSPKIIAEFFRHKN